MSNDNKFLPVLGYDITNGQPVIVPFEDIQNGNLLLAECDYEIAPNLAKLPESLAKLYTIHNVKSVSLGSIQAKDELELVWLLLDLGIAKAIENKDWSVFKRGA